MMTGLRSVHASSFEDAMRLVAAGHKSAQMARTALNENSSRSHTVLYVRLVRAEQAPTSTGANSDESVEYYCPSRPPLIRVHVYARTSIGLLSHLTCFDSLQRPNVFPNILWLILKYFIYLDLMQKVKKFLMSFSYGKETLTF